MRSKRRTCPPATSCISECSSVTGEKNWTIVEGLPAKMLGYPVNFEKILKALKKSFKTNGAIQGSTEGSSVIQLQGDFRRETRDWMVANGLAEEKGVVVHGT
mmetsp:Transcript_21177/g.53953  ORF Transcript_21177/g.53953 Transcript_21177/m.53953 type:complete len:102 (+) Transcript_21177:96-401(+)